MDQNKIYVSYWTRLIAAFCESALLSVDLFVVLYLLSLQTGSIYTFLPAVLLALIYLVFVHVVLLFFARVWFISSMGGFIGKLIAGIAIEHENGEHLTVKRALFREYIAKIASSALLGFGYFWILKNAKRQAWHDMLSDTFVVKKNSFGVWLALVVIIVALCADGVFTFMSLNNFSKSDNLVKELVSLGSQIEDSVNKMLPSKNTTKPLDVPYIPPTFTE